MTVATPHLLEAVVVGAGPAGLSAAKELLSACPEFRNDGRGDGEISRRKIVVLEESDAVGGMWHRSGEAHRPDDGEDCPGRLYVSDDGEDGAEISVATSCQPLYDGLVANLPKHLIASETRLIPTTSRRWPVLITLHDLLPYIQFLTRVVRCSKAIDAGGTSFWEVKAIEQCRDGSKDDVTYRSKRLVVCTGHHRKAYVPPFIRGARHFSGGAMHSSAFRSPDQFREGSTVLIVGGGISGADIAKILVRSTKKDDRPLKVFVSVREWKFLPHALLLRKLKKEGMVRPGISHVDEAGFVHFDASAVASSEVTAAPVRPDAIIFATGYRCHYPFLPNNGGFIWQEGHGTHRLYLGMLHADDPSLAFLHSLAFLQVPIILIEYQSRWYAQYVRGNLEVVREKMEAGILSRNGDPTLDDLKTGIFAAGCAGRKALANF
ncbi:hypothetical protein ACHAWF_016854 [Thalassiosira exigua]